ncbi:MAG: cation:proton antiporter [Hoeflea sp.]|uniref:cation:proton antiporter n=1 Tax=Hoeflea sp. TaxID=1940281 RepID=UPI0032EBE543
MTVQAIFDLSVSLTLAILCLAFLVTIFRIVRGPTLPDRILGLDMLVAIAIGFIAVVGIKTGYTLYVDVAIALGLVGFLATVAFARFVLSRGKTEDDILTEARMAADQARNEARAARKAEQRSGAAGRVEQRGAASRAPTGGDR